MQIKFPWNLFQHWLILLSQQSWYLRLEMETASNTENLIAYAAKRAGVAESVLCLTISLFAGMYSTVTLLLHVRSHTGSII